MADFVTLSCPNCGGKLQITNDIDRFACGHCGKEQVVRRSGGIVSLAPVVQGLKQVQVGVDKTASELAIQRLSPEIAKLESQLQQYTRWIAASNDSRQKPERPDRWFDGIISYPLYYGAIIFVISLLVFLGGYREQLLIVIMFMSGIASAISFFILRSINSAYAENVSQQTVQNIEKWNREIADIRKQLEPKRLEFDKHKKIIDQ